MTTIPRPIFDRTLNYGNVIQIFLLLVMIVGGGVYMVRWQGDVENKLADAEAARVRYIPIVDALVKSDAIQDERMGNLADAVIEIRRSQVSITEKLSQIGSSVAVIEERTKSKVQN